MSRQGNCYDNAMTEGFLALNLRGYRKNLSNNRASLFWYCQLYLGLLSKTQTPCL